MLRPIIVRFQRFSLSLRQRYRRFLITLLMGIWLTIGGTALSQEIHLGKVSNAPVSQQVEAGRAAYAEQDFEGAIALWHQALQQYTEQADPRHQAMVLTYLSLAHQHLNQWPLAEDTVQTSLRLLNYHDSDHYYDSDDIDSIMQASRSPFLLAQALNAHGRLHLALGQAQRAAISWQQAAGLYGELNDRDGEMGSRVNQVEAIATLGHYRQACRILVKTLAGSGHCDLDSDAEFEALLHTINQASDPSIRVLGLRTLGNLLRLVGQVERSRQVLLQGLAIVQQYESGSLPLGPSFLGPSSLGPLSEQQQSIFLGLAETEKATLKRQLDILDRTFQPRRQGAKTIQVVRAQGAIALDYYQQAAQFSASATTEQVSLVHQLIQRQTQAQQLRLLLDLRDWLGSHNQDVTTEVASIQRILTHLFSGLATELPASHLSIYAQLNIAQSLMRINVDGESNHVESNHVEPDVGTVGFDNNDAGHNTRQRWQERAIHLVEGAVEDAIAIQDQRAQSYSLGVLGAIREQHQEWSLAQQHTQRALAIAHQLPAPAADLAYQWQWQLGRIAAAQQRWQQAIAQYTLAFETLQDIRHDLVFLNPDVQFSFQDTIEPVYRQLVEVLFRAEFQPESSSRVEASLQKARVVMDALQVAEVENFLGQACTEAELAVIDQVVDQADQQAALIYTIVLQDQLGVILKLPQRDRLQFHSVPISQTDVEASVAQLYSLLQQKLPSRAKQTQQHSQQVYNWLVAPFAETLANQNIQTLVFVLDGPLQTIPMATLFDGNHYLIESYAIATTPGLQLVNPAPLEPRSLDALVAGWITPPPNSPLMGLPGVADEVASIQRTLGRIDILTDRAFTATALADQINRRAVPIVHLATHGQFSSQPEQTFIATGDGDRLTLDQLGTLLQSRDATRPNPIQLLFLSACQTLTGDKRAALGMAGLAVRSGARSTIASLWQADDEATAQLVAQFYQALITGENGEGVSLPRQGKDHPNATLSKAAALQAAQLELLHNPRFSLPVYWSPFVLLGDWL